jgi:multimeric flavodoxin WrbA
MGKQNINKQAHALVLDAVWDVLHGHITPGKADDVELFDAIEHVLTDVLKLYGIKDVNRFSNAFLSAIVQKQVTSKSRPEIRKLLSGLAGFIPAGNIAKLAINLSIKIAVEPILLFAVGETAITAIELSNRGKLAIDHIDSEEFARTVRRIYEKKSNVDPRRLIAMASELPNKMKNGKNPFKSRKSEILILKAPPKKFVAINGSPRKGWNTHALVTSAMEGAAAAGAETKLFNLYDLKYTGCLSCFGCKRVGSDHVGRCVLKDGLRPLLGALDACDAFVIGSPIYIGEVTAATRALIERLTFQYITYQADIPTFKKTRPEVGLIYTMNVPESALDELGYSAKFAAYESLFDRVIGPAQSLISTETWQTKDYSKYGITFVDEAERVKRHETVFPEDIQKARDLGAALVQ